MKMVNIGSTIAFILLGMAILAAGQDAASMAHAVFFGFHTKVPAGTQLNLSFVPTFNVPSTHSLRAQASGAVVVPAIFSIKGRDAIVGSECGVYNRTTGLYRGNTTCVASLVRHVLEADERTYVAAPDVIGPHAIPSTDSGAPVSFSGTTSYDVPEGFYFAVLSTSTVPVALASINITASDLRSMTMLPDVILPAAHGTGR